MAAMSPEASRAYRAQSLPSSDSGFLMETLAVEAEPLCKMGVCITGAAWTTCPKMFLAGTGPLRKRSRPLKKRNPRAVGWVSRGLC